jgi:hypothetical protein
MSDFKEARMRIRQVFLELNIKDDDCSHALLQSLAMVIVNGTDGPLKALEATSYADAQLRIYVEEANKQKYQLPTSH